MSFSEKAPFMAVTEDNFRKEVIDSPRPVLVEFTADWCSLCRVNQPVMDELSEKYADRMKFVKVDTDVDPGLTQIYKIKRRPTVLILEKGIPKERINGVVPRNVYAEIIEKSLGD